jgi:hypothetical protein
MASSTLLQFNFIGIEVDGKPFLHTPRLLSGCSMMIIKAVINGLIRKYSKPLERMITGHHAEVFISNSYTG